MRLSPRELDKLVLCQVGTLAQKRLARGVRLNHAEAVALVSMQLLEWIRDGRHSVAELMNMGRQILGRRQVMPAVWHTLDEVQVEGTFPDGTKLVTVHQPISTDEGNLAMAFYGSFLPIPDPSLFPPINPRWLDESLAPGAVVTLDESPITINSGRELVCLHVTNNGDRPVQVGSHYHFAETNPKLCFDRVLASGKRLNIPAGTAVRFEPGETKVVTLVAIGGTKQVSGGNNIGPNPDPKNLLQRGFLHKHQDILKQAPVPFTMPRSIYAQAYGPTVGDSVRLADTELWIKIEKDFTDYGDECVFGGGKVIREGMGQSNFVGGLEELDLVITNAIVLDYTGIYKADIGIKNGNIVGIGKAGNPEVMDGVHSDMIIGPGTEVLAGEGKIVTAGALDVHVHFICPQLCIEALSSGITTVIGGGTGPNTGTNATTCTPGANHIRFMLQATDDLPLNIGFTGKGNSANIRSLREQVHAGALGLKLHEDWGTTPAAIDACLTLCDEEDVQSTIHTDTLNESGFVESTIEAFRGRTIHAYHCEGAGGGHAPDIITICSHPNVLPSSTNPTRPYTVNTMDEHLDMLMVCHHLDRGIPEDIAFAESRIRGETIGAEDILHDLGAISIISSDSQAMGRVGEVISRTWQTADKMKKKHGQLLSDGKSYSAVENKDDNFRAKRYISKYTINPAIAHGVSHVVGSVERGKLADLVLWDPKFFGTKPDVVLKGGVIAWAQMGDANASIPTPQPVIGRPMFGSFPSSIRCNSASQGAHSLAFVSGASIETVRGGYGLKKRIVSVKNCRGIGKCDMRWNSEMPEITVDPETYEVKVDGIVCKMDPADSVAMSGNHYIF